MHAKNGEPLVGVRGVDKGERLPWNIKCAWGSTCRCVWVSHMQVKARAFSGGSLTEVSIRDLHSHLTEGCECSVVSDSL